MDSERNESELNAWYDRKSALMESLLGAEHDMVMHALIPYAIGGALDLYYYPNGIEGTGIATKELSESTAEFSTNDAFEKYELVMFTRHALSLDDANDASTPFGRAHGNINAILNPIASYSAQATLNPNETCEFPDTMPDVGGKCLIFDAYKNDAPSRIEFGLLLIIEIFRSEMEFAQREGGGVLLARLRQHGHYPYSNLDRDPVA